MKILFFLILSINLSFANKKCWWNFEQLPTFNSHSHYTAKILVENNLDDFSYMSLWKSKESTKGQWHAEGNTLVSGVTSAMKKKWLESIGNRSIGLVLDGHPPQGGNYPISLTASLAK